MLTGDDERIGKSVADETWSGLRIMHSLLPDQKVEKLEMLDKQKRQGSKLAFVGDGINDAPVLARADVGIAMGGLGSDAAIEAADVVLMTDEPSKLVEAIDVAKGYETDCDAEHRDCSWHQERVPCSGRTRHGRYVGSRVR